MLGPNFQAGGQIPHSDNLQDKKMVSQSHTNCCMCVASSKDVLMRLDAQSLSPEVNTLDEAVCYPLPNSDLLLYLRASVYVLKCESDKDVAV